MTKTLTIDDFADLFGCSVDELPPHCQKLIAEGTWDYEEYTKEERDEIILEFLNRIRDRQFSFVVEGDNARWVKGWGENRDAFQDTGDLDALTPKYIRPNMPVRLFGDFVKTKDPYFEKHWYHVFREWLLTTYFKGFDNIFEFGCGSGFNVARLAELFPEATVHGLDWVQPSVDIVDGLKTAKGLNTVGHLFDFFNPNYDIEIPENSAVLTIGALEQTGTNNKKFQDFLLDKKPRLIVHVEPTYDWYDPESLIDYLAITAHDLRNFWRGYHERLDDLEAKGKVEVLKRKRADFGSIVLEGYSQTIWRPI